MQIDHRIHEDDENKLTIEKKNYVVARKIYQWKRKRKFHYQLKLKQEFYIEFDIIYKKQS